MITNDHISNCISVPPLSELAPEIEHYWGEILDRSFSEGATNTVAAAEVANVENGDVDEGLPGWLSSMSC